MDKQIREISKKRTWKRILKRSVALLCAVVMLFTMNTLKRNADTLERIAMCGYAEHVHSASCFSGDVLVCGMEEHIHTDACYQESPASMDMDDLDIEVESPIVDDTVEELDLSLALDDLDLVTEDVTAEPVSNEAEEKVYRLGNGAMVSQIIEAVGLSVGLDEIKEVGAVENDEAHSGLIAVEKVDSDYRVRAKKDFDEAELALILADDILVVELRDGVAQGEGVTPEVQPAIEETPSAQIDAADPAELPAIEDAPTVDAYAGDDEHIEVPVIEDEDPVDGQDEDAVHVEDVSPEAEQQAGKVEQPEVEDVPGEQAGEIAQAEQPAGAQGDEQPAEESEEEQPVEEAAEEQGEEQPAEEAGEAQSEEQSAEEAGEAQGEELAVEEADEAQGEEQPAEEAGEAQGEELAVEEGDEAQSEEQPAEEAGEAQGEELAVEEADEAQGEEQPAEEAAEAQDEELAVEESAEEQGEEQPAEEVAEEQGEEQPAEEAAEDKGEEQLAEEVAEEQGEEQPAEETDEEQGEEQPAEEAAEEQGEEQPAEEAAEEQGEEEFDEETADEQGEEQPAEETAEEQGEEQSAEDQGEDQPADKTVDEQGEEQPAEEATEEQSEEQSAEEATEEQGEEQPAEAQPTDESEPTVYTATIDLTDVETYPLSLNAMLTAATPEQEEIEEEAIDGEAQEDQAEEQTTLTIDYDEALLEVVEQDGDYLVTPIQSFESTQIIVNNGSRYELTLVNCVLKAEEQEEQSVPVHTATIDLTNATYPLSLNELITGVAPKQAESEQPEEQPEIEQSEAQNEQQVEEQPTLTIDYDEALLEIVESDGNWLVTPVQSFESTQITVTNGSRYELTLVNCVLTDGEQEEQEVIYPAQTFEGHTAYVKVSVTAPEGAFPEDTTMTVADVEDEQTITDIEETVSEGFVEVKRVHAVDISFWNGETEIEPLVPISVVITVAEIEEQQDAVVVHVDNEGATEVVESQSEAPAGGTEVTVEMPASEAGSAPSDAEKQGEEQPAEDSESPEEEQTDAVTFEADSFSVYAVVVTETIETKYIDAEGGTWDIRVGFTKEANIPAGATLAVSEVESADYLSEAEAALEGGKRVTLARFFDINIVDEAGREVQPEVPVTVNISLDNTAVESIDAVDHVIDNSDPVAVAMHFEEKDDSISVDVKQTTETEGAVVFDADGFSVWGVVYTVDFYFGDYEYHLPGEGYITLSDLFGKLEIEADATQAVDVVFSNPELLAVRKIAEGITLSSLLAEMGLDEAPVAEVDVELGEDQEAPEASDEETVLHGPDWLLVSLAPFDTEEKLTVTMEDGAVYEIRVEDNASYAYHIRVSNTNRGYISGGENAIKNGRSKQYKDNRVIAFDGNAGDTVYNVVATPINEYNERAVFWLDHEGNTIPYREYNDSLTLEKTVLEALTEETTCIAYFVPKEQTLTVVKPASNGSVEVTEGQLRDAYENGSAFPKYCFTENNTKLKAIPNDGYYFKGWYVGDACISTSNTLDVNSFSGDKVVAPVFEKKAHYNVIANEEGKGYFYILAWGNTEYKGTSLNNLPTESVTDAGVCSFRFPVETRANVSGYDFAYWLRDDKTIPFSDANLHSGSMDNTKQLFEGSSLIGFRDSQNQPRDYFNEIDRDTTYIAFYKPLGDHIVLLNAPTEGGRVGVAAGSKIPRSVNPGIDGLSPIQFFYIIEDKCVIKATPNTDWAFVGWFDNGSDLVSTDLEFDVYTYFTQHPTEFRDLNLTPVFKRVDPHFHVWFDGTNGVGGGGNPANNTFYTRITSKNDIIGSTSVYQRVEKRDAGTDNPYAIITLPTTAVAPQGVGQNKYALQGWYCVYPDVCEAIEGQTEITSGKCYKPGTQVKITGDAVFYADWFPVDSDYSVSVNTSIEPKNLSTSRFITTHVFDYNNLFNMNSIYLNQGQSVIPTADAAGNWQNYNKEYWYMNGNANDFIFLSTVSGQGRSLNPFGRDYKNQNREISTNGGYYTGTRTTELLSSNLRSRLFDTSDGLGKRYLGTGDKLYSYDSSTGYFYYDSDKNAASYNKAAQQFYVYDYTNKTNKSNGGDNTDFMPFNYGETTFTEAYGEPNYWFGMSSEINFFLPNAVNGKEITYDPDNGVDERVNFSDHDREMVYKFAGDDDVWVYVDDQLILDMGGVHGKIYGEINFSRGTWQIAQEGTERIWDGDGILSYANNGNLSQHDFINLSEGDHTLTLYYLERGASQSNCAIYFNIAPRYGLRFIKQDDEGNRLGNIRFGIYTDPECTIAADLKNNSGADTNEFFDGSGDGMTHARNLVAGRTYYIKEIKAPNGYPDMSSHIIKLELDAHGKAKITPPADATWMVNTTGLTEVANETGTYYLGKVTGEPDMYLLTVVNKNETSITASKTWAMLDGSTFVAVTGQNTSVNTNATAKIKLQRRVLAEAGTQGAVQMGNHKVKLVTRYFVDGSGTPSSRDNSGLKQIRAATYSVKDNNDLSFTLNAPSGSGIYSVVASSGNLTASNVSGSSGTLYINGGTGTKPTRGTYTLSGVQSDAVIYITFIGTGTPSAPTPSITSNIEARWVVENTAFNESQTEDNGGIVTLNSANDWTTTWDRLESSDASDNTYYYYVTEVGGSTANIPEGKFATSFISTTSSDGLSSGTIMVNNTLQSVRVMLRKRDAVKPDGKNVYLSGGKYELHIGNVGGDLYSPSSNALDNSSMGSINGAGLTGDNVGRFYTGYLPVGTYYLVETEAPEGYEPTTARQIVVNESGISWDRDGNGELVEAPLDSNGYYSLYLNDTVKKGSILIQKLWKSESNYGLTKDYANAYSTGEFGLDNSKLYSTSDNGATAVLLSLGAVVDGAVNADVVNEVLNNPGSHGLTDKVVEVNGKKYIRLEKNGTWPALAINNLPLKHRFIQNEAGVSKDIWFFIEEYGYYDANGQLVLVANKTPNWTVSYGYANSVSNGTGKTDTINGTMYTLVKPKTSNPDTLTVTNGFKGGLEFTKKNAVTNAPVQGAVFQIIPNGAGEGNYITGADAMLTSDSNGKVTISGLPVGTYWMWEKSAPDGYRKLDAMYCLVIGYPNSQMYLVDGNDWTATDVIDNTPVGSISIAKTVQVGDVDSTELAGKTIWFGLFDSQVRPEDDPVKTPIKDYYMTLGNEATTTQTAFTDLELGTYYVYELDAYGHPILNGGTMLREGKAYTVSEATPNVTFSAAGQNETVAIINNRETTAVSVTKAWSDGTWPAWVDRVQVTLMSQSGTAQATEATVTESTNGNAASATLTKPSDGEITATATWTNLPVKDADGNPITYTVTETAVIEKDADGQDVAYTATSAVTLSEKFQIATVQPTDGHATITNELKQTTINVLKKNAETQAALPGAVFKLERKSNGVYSVYGEPQTSGSNGTLSFANLPDGEYRLEETGIPAGYARTSSGMFIYFTIDQYGVTRTYDGESPILETDNSVSYVNNQFTVDNTPGVSLPSTGGMGTAPICAAGLGMIVVAVLGLMLRRRKARDVIE